MLNSMRPFLLPVLPGSLLGARLGHPALLGIGLGNRLGHPALLGYPSESAGPPKFRRAPPLALVVGKVLDL